MKKTREGIHQNDPKRTSVDAPTKRASTKHTPTPWHMEVSGSKSNPTFEIRGGEYGQWLATIPAGWNAQEDTSFIVRAVNAHDDLLAACKEALAFIEARTYGFVIDAKDSLRLAIDKAEGRKK